MRLQRQFIKKELLVRAVKLISRITMAGIVCFLLLCTIKDDNGNLALTGPHSNTGPGTNTTSAAPALIVTPDSMFIGIRESLSIAITVMQDSTLTHPLVNARVLCSKTRGFLSAETLYTDSRGRAVLKMMDTTKSSVQIVISCGTVTQTLQIDVTDTPDKVQKRIQVFPGKAVLKADGSDFTTIQVILMNENNNPIVGQCVQFISSAGMIAGQGTGCANSGQSATDAGGIARATLTSANINDTAFITVFLVSDRTKTAQTRVVFNGVNILVTADSTNLNPGQSAIISAHVLNGSNEPIPYVPIYFSLGKDTGSVLTFVSKDSATGPEGTAQCVVKSKSTQTGTDSIRILAAGASSSIRINVTNLLLSISLDDKILQANASKFTTLHVTFASNTGTPLANKDIQLKRTYQQIDGKDTSDVLFFKTDAQGKCAVTIYALPYESSMSLEVTAFNTATDIASAKTTLSFIASRSITINAIPTMIQADGTSSSAITVQVKNESYNPMVGEEISFTTTAGLVTAIATTDGNGRAVATLISDRRNTIATVKATLVKDATKTASVQVEFTGVQLTASANPPSINANGKDSSTIAITLIDAAKNPIVGEPINFSKLQDSTFIYKPDSVTDNRGEAHCKVFGKGIGTDTIRIEAAGASQKVAINYSSNYLAIDTASGQSCIANGTDSTGIVVTYLLGDKTTPVQNATIDASITLGTLNNDTIFAKRFTLTPANNGRIVFYVKNPSFANTATISAYAKTSVEVTSATFQLYFKASKIKKVELTGTPSVISTNGGKATLTAVVYDVLGNRVKDERVYFNMTSGPGTGEHIDPASAITGDDGAATSFLISGTAPSMFHGVGIVASDVSGVKSDTTLFTIAGPPNKVSVGVNLQKGTDFQDGTFGLPCAAVVTDINGNPVADGTPVTFSIQVSGYVCWKLVPIWEESVSQGAFSCYYHVVSDSFVLPFEDFNNNFRLDPGEDRNNDGFANRGADMNGDGIYDPGPPYEDINHDGRRQFDLNTPVEQIYLCSNGGRKFADLNGDGVWDPIEPLLDPTYKSTYDTLRSDSAYLKLYFKQPIPSADSVRKKLLDSMDLAYKTNSHFYFINGQGSYDFSWDKQPYPQPDPAVSIARTVQTQNGKAANVIIYGQSNAKKVEVMVWAECQGVVPEFPVQQVLPVINDTVTVK
jgi:hypothetical protein